MSRRDQKHQLNVVFDAKDFARITKLAKGAGISNAAFVRAIVIDVLRDDAIAHGEAAE